MESRRGFASRRILLPSEVELCNVLGLSEEEYWFFVDKTASYNGQRSEAYDLVPDIQATGLEPWAIQLIIGVALTVVSYLMTPKPKQPKTPPSLRTSDQTGIKRFAPQTWFNSVQELAKLGEIIPLVFTRRENGHGGIRINTKLIWSQMKSHWSGQQLRGLFLLSKSEFESEPDFTGYAIGDTTLANYTNSKIALYHKMEGERITTIDKYSEGSLEEEKGSPDDVFSVWWDDLGEYSSSIVSGTRTPGSQTQFGAFAPMANGMSFRVPYELVLKGKDLSKSNKIDVDKKRKKIETNFSRFAGITDLFNSDSEMIWDEDFYMNPGVPKKLATVFKDYQVIYQVLGLNPAEENNYEEEFKPHGMDDVKSSIDADRITTDNNLAIGDSYLIGSALGICKKIEYTDPHSIWIPDSGINLKATFDITDKGLLSYKGHIREEVNPPYSLTVIQRVALGTISTNTKCQVTEIGIKSKVWKQITSFPNVNSHPGNVKYGQRGIVANYEADNGNISLGQLSKYINRYSFFRLQGRIAGLYPMEEWKYIDGGIPFAVKGNAPQPQYNFIRINHVDTHQYEFRFVPYPGNLIQRELRDNAMVVIRLFQKNTLGKVENDNSGFDIYYSGDLYTLTGNRASNSEWYLGDLPKIGSHGSAALSLAPSGNGITVPLSKGWVHVATKKYKYDRSDYEVISGVKWFYPYQKNAGLNGRKINADFYWNSKRVGKIHIKQPAQYSSKRHADLYVWPPRFEGIEDNEKWSVERDGIQYRIGSVTKNDMRRAESADILKYERDNSDASTVYKDLSTTTVTGEGSGLTLDVKIYENTPKAITWQVHTGGSGYRSGDKVKFTVPNEDTQTEIAVLTDSGLLTLGEPWPIGNNLNPYDAISDFVQYEAERSSHQDGPEHELVYVNEMNKETRVSYPGLSYIGLSLNSSKEWSSFPQLSAYVKKGIKVKRLINDNIEATNLFPEIAYTLLTDLELGAGELVGVASVDKKRMEIATKFCKANGFFWDGVITESQNLREFIFEMAGYCFLDFTILGGKFSLIPSVPYGKDFKIKNDASFSDPDGTSDLKTQALFTDGNIKDLKVSFLSPEERQVFQGRALYRRETENGFPETKVFELGLHKEQSSDDYISGNGGDDPIETFDMSSFCTEEEHVRKFLKYALRVRQLIDHGIKFQTAPQFAMFLSPGAYFRLYSESTHTSRFENGFISSDGTIQSIGEGDLTDVEIYYWKSGMDEVREAKLKVIDGKVDNSNLVNSVFTVKKKNTSDRVYKVESIVYGEEGLIEIAGSHVPLTESGSLAILNWNEDDFT